MIACNTSDLEKNLRTISETFDRKLTNMVKLFSNNVIEGAVSNTPLGDNISNSEYYSKRETDMSWQSYGLEPIAGFAQGSWRNSTDPRPAIQDIYSGNKAIGKAYGDLSNYKLGKTVYITNYGPYINNLEAGSSDQASQGIMAPTIDLIMRTYNLELVNYFKES